MTREQNVIFCYFLTLVFPSHVELVLTIFFQRPYEGASIFAAHRDVTVSYLIFCFIVIYAKLDEKGDKPEREMNRIQMGENKHCRSESVGSTPPSQCWVSCKSNRKVYMAALCFLLQPEKIHQIG